MGWLFSFFVIKNSRLAIYAILFSVAFLDFLYAYTPLPRQLSWLPEVMIIALTINATSLLVSKRINTDMLNKPLLFIFSSLILEGICSGFANNCSPIITVLGFRNHLKNVVFSFCCFF